MINLYITPRILFFITIVLILLSIHLFYGCCAITINKSKNTEPNNPIFNTNNESTILSDKYSPENHFYMPNKSLSAEEIKNIAHRGGNNNI